MNRKIVMDLIGFELIALVVVVGYKLSPLLLPTADQTILPNPVCNLHREACTVALPGGGSVELAFGTRPIPLVKPFPVTVTVSGVQPEVVAIDFAGVDMNMGFNRPQLNAVGQGRFVGEASLPVCVSGGMDWQATLLIEQGRQRIAVPFRFTSGNHD